MLGFGCACVCVCGLKLGCLNVRCGFALPTGKRLVTGSTQHTCCGLTSAPFLHPPRLSQAPHIHFLLLEAADILRLHPLPRLHVVKAPAPFVRLLRIPVGSMMPSKAAAWGTTNNKTSNSSSSAVPKCQRATILVLSSAAMQLLEPAELQAAMSGALAPLALEGAAAVAGAGWDAHMVLCDMYLPAWLSPLMLLVKELSNVCLCHAHKVWRHVRHSITTTTTTCRLTR